MSVKIDPEGPRRSKKDPVRLRKLRQTSQAAFAASSFSSWFWLASLIRKSHVDILTHWQEGVKLASAWELKVLFGYVLWRQIMIFNSLESFSYAFPASISMHIIFHDHAVNKFTKLVTLDLLATNVLSRAKVQLIKISAILKNLDFWSNLYL